MRDTPARLIGYYGELLISKLSTIAGWFSKFEKFGNSTYNVRMSDLEFEWDPKKEKANAKKNGVSFDDARTAFYDEAAMVFHDPDHSSDEDRFILLGMSVRAGVLVVCHCVRDSDLIVRIISARRADKREETDYWEYRA